MNLFDRRACLAALSIAGGLASLAPAAPASHEGVARATPIVFLNNNDPSGKNDVWTMNVDGSNAKRLTADSVQDCDPVWSPDGTQIAWVTTAGDDVSELFVMNADGSDRTQLTSSPSEYVRTPTWSHDGNTLYFLRSEGEGTVDKDIGISSISRADGGWGPESRVLDTADGWEYAPRVSPDGNLLAFERDPDGAGALKADIHTVPVAGMGSSTPVRQTDHAANEDWPSWSPDGRKLVFQREGSIYTVPVNSDGTVRAPTYVAGGVHPDWSRTEPDVVAFTASGDITKWNLATGRKTAIRRKGSDGAPDW